MVGWLLLNFSVCLPFLVNHSLLCNYLFFLTFYFYFFFSREISAETKEPKQKRNEKERGAMMPK